MQDIPYLTDPTKLEIVKLIAAIAASIVGMLVTAGAGILTLKKLGLFAWLDKRYIEPRRAARQSIADDITKIKKQLEPNGGESIYDKVELIHKKTEYLQARARYQDDTSDEAVFELDQGGNLTSANRAFCELVGHPESRLHHRDWISRASERDRARILTALHDAINNQMPLDLVVAFRNGSIKSPPIHLIADPYISPRDRQLVRFFGRAEAAQ